MNFKGIVLLSNYSKLAEVQFAIDSCRLVSKSNNLNNSNKDCDWLILACFIGEQNTADATLLVWKRKFGLKIQQIALRNYYILYHKPNKEAASTVLSSVINHLGSGTVFKKLGKTLDQVSCFPLNFLRALPLPACFTTEQSRVEASLFVNCKKSWAKQ